MCTWIVVLRTCIYVYTHSNTYIYFSLYVNHIYIYLTIYAENICMLLRVSISVYSYVLTNNNAYE